MIQLAVESANAFRFLRTDMSAFVTIMKDTAAGKPYSESEFRIKNSSGRYCWCRIRVTAQFDDVGRAVKEAMS